MGSSFPSSVMDIHQNIYCIPISKKKKMQQANTSENVISLPKVKRTEQ